MPTVPYTFATQTGNIPLSELDANFSTLASAVPAYANTAGTVTSNVQANITGVGTLTSLTVTGNITGNYIIGNGSQLTGLQSFVGATGVSGVNGATGSQGPQGATGVAGVNGATGVAGVNGATGLRGATGIQGLVGATGTFSGILTANIDGNGYTVSNVSSLGVTGNITASNVIGNIVVTGGGTPTVSSNTNLILSSPTVIQTTGGGLFRLPTLTSAQIGNLTAANGDMVYNTTLNKFQGYENGAWGNLI